MKSVRISKHFLWEERNVDVSEKCTDPDVIYPSDPYRGLFTGPGSPFSDKYNGCG
jgi:hypothetical protein